MFPEKKWWAIAESKTIRNKPIGLRRLGEDLVLWRDLNGQIVCQSSLCAHRRANMALGRVNNGCIECPYHGFRYAPDGHCTFMPCEGKEAHISPMMRIKTYIVREEHDLIWLWWGKEQVEYPPIPWFAHLPDYPIRWASGAVDWNVTFTRTAENLLLDIHHFSFLHRGVANFFSLTSYTLLEIDEQRKDDDFFYFSGRLLPEEAGSDKESKERFPLFQHWLRFPNMGLLDLAFGGMEFLVIVTPIDEENTWAYFRYYAQYINTWISRWMSRLAAWIEINFILPDDYKICLSLQPRHSSLSSLSLNKFVPADEGIIIWHKQYDSLLHSEESIEGSDQQVVGADSETFAK
jgi:phenylpropionate dioxygenase-like ring-hydroxylating dioxygenase large terminal subunit